MQKDRNLTIVIPTYGKDIIVGEAVKYWLGLNLNVIVVDGSPSPSETLGSTENSSFEYCHLPLSFIARINFAMEKIRTDYVLVLPDDEIWTEEAILASIDILDKNKEIDFVFTQAVEFYEGSNGVSLKPGYPHFYGYYGKSKSRFIRILALALFYLPSGIYSVARRHQ